MKSRRSSTPRSVDRSRAKPHVDLVGVVRGQLVAAGLSPQNVDRVGGCTHANADRWFSYRRDGAGIGQMLAFIRPEPLRPRLRP